MPPFADYETASPQNAATWHHSDSSQSVARQNPDRSQPRNPAEQLYDGHFQAVFVKV